MRLLAGTLSQGQFALCDEELQADAAQANRRR
jgi:hypothetical protein